MLRDLLSSRWFQGGLAFFVLCVCGSLLYSWHVKRSTEAELERSNRFLRGTEQQKATRPPETVIVENTNDTPVFVNTPDENTDTPMSDGTEALPNETDPRDFVDAILPDDFVSEEEQVSEDGPVSPFGFGSYPEVPTDFPFKVAWTDTTEHIDMELSARVMIKAWNEGERFLGSSIGENGRVYLHYPKTVYVQERKHIAPDGSGRGSSRLIIGDIHELSPGESLPGDLQVLDYNSAGIDPYEYLDLLSKEHTK